MSTPFRCAWLLIGTLAVASACEREKPLSPVEREAKNRGECHVIAVSQSQFDPTLAQEPARTISETHKAGGDVVRRRQETQKMVTTTRANPAYTAYVAAKSAYRSAFDGCMSARSAPAQAN